MSTRQAIGYRSRITDLQTAIGKGDVAGALCAAGDVLRRTQVLGVDAKEIETTLSALSAERVLQVIATLDASAMHARLARGIEEAFEALLAEDPSERAMWEKEALEALRERDRLESMRVAFERRMGESEQLDAKIAAVDAELVKKARCLVGLNDVRREELAQLDPQAREGAWWYAARSQSDALGAVLAGRKNPDPAFAASAEDRKELEYLARIEVPPTRVDGESLWLKEIGAASTERSRWATRHLDAKDQKAADIDVD
jgi:hypothetical protein